MSCPNCGYRHYTASERARCQNNHRSSSQRSTVEGTSSSNYHPVIDSDVTWNHNSSSSSCSSSSSSSYDSGSYDSGGGGGCD